MTFHSEILRYLPRPVNYPAGVEDPRFKFRNENVHRPLSETLPPESANHGRDHVPKTVRLEMLARRKRHK